MTMPLPTRSQTLEELHVKVDKLSESTAGIEALTQSINNLVISQTQQNAKLNEILTTVSNNEAAISAVREDLSKYKTTTDKRIDNLEEQVHVNVEHENRISTVERELKTIKNSAKIAKLLSEFRSKKYNLIINGIPEKSYVDANGLMRWELIEDTVAATRNFFADVLGVDKMKNWRFAHCHRLELPTNGGTRGIIVRFTEWFDKSEVMSNLYKLKDHNSIEGGSRIYVSEHLPDRMAKQRKLLLPEYKKARALKKKTNWAVDKKTADYILYVDRARVDSGYESDEG